VRRRHVAIVVSLLLALTISAVALPSPLGRSATAAPEQVYLALGDSIAAGLITTLPSSRGYPWLIQNLMQQLNTGNGQPSPVTLEDLAVPGETATSFLKPGGQLDKAKQAISDIQANGADLRLLTVTLGGNDILDLQAADLTARQQGLAAFKTDFPAALSAIKSALGSLKPVIVVTTYYDPSGGDPTQQGSDAWWVAQFNDVIKTTAQQDGAKVADLAPAFQGHIDDWTWEPADVHPNNDGHAEIAKLIWQQTGFDTSAPKVTIERPAAGKLSRDIPTILAKATDNVGVTGVQLLVNDSVVSDMIYEPSLDAYAMVWDGTASSGKQVKLSVQASDLAGNQTSATVTVTLP